MKQFSQHQDANTWDGLRRAAKQKLGYYFDLSVTGQTRLEKAWDQEARNGWECHRKTKRESTSIGDRKTQNGLTARRDGQQFNPWLNPCKLFAFSDAISGRRVQHRPRGILSRQRKPQSKGGDDMREDHMETLDKMYPDGYLIVYTNKDGQLRLSLYNPHQDQTIERYHNLLKENA